MTTDRALRELLEETSKEKDFSKKSISEDTPAKLLDGFVDKFFAQQVDEIKNPKEFLSKPYEPLFCTFYRIKTDELKKVIAQKDSEKDLMKMGYLQFCENFAYALRTLDLTAAVFKEGENGKVTLVDESKASGALAENARKALQVMFNDQKNNMTKCRKNNLVVKDERSDGTIEYKFLHPTLINYFTVRKSREMNTHKTISASIPQTEIVTKKVAQLRIR